MNAHWIERMYLDYVNNFLTVERFAEYYRISYSVAVDMLATGKRLNRMRGEQ